MSELIFTKTGKNLLSGNAIEFELAISPYNAMLQKETVYLIASVSQQTSRGATTFQEIKSQKFYPNDAGIVSLDVSSIIDAYLSYFVPPADLDQLMEIPHSQLKQFQVKFSLFDDLVPLAEEIKTISAIKAGESYQYFNTDFSYPAGDPAPEEKLLYISSGKETVTKEDLAFIFFTTAPGSEASVFARVNVDYLLAGTMVNTGYQTTGLPDLPTYFAMFCLPVGFNQIKIADAIDSAAIIISYDISIFKGTPGGTEVLLFDPVKFTIDQRKFYDSTQLLYRSSLGSLQHIRLLGEIDMQADYKFQTIAKIPPPSYLLDGNIIGQQDQLYNEEDIKYIGDTGFLSKYQAERLRDFFLSKQRFEIKDGRLIPIILNSKTIKFFSNKDNLFSVAVEWQHAFTNNFFGNPNILPDACPAINELTWRQTNANEITLFYSLPFGFNYFSVNLIFPGEDPQTFFVEGNSGAAKITFIRPDSATGDVELSVTANIICHRYNNEPDLGATFTVPDRTLTPELLPLAINDTYTIASGFTSPVTLSGSVLINDYSPAGNTLEVNEASGSTTLGGSYSIDAAGIISYTPPSGSFNGADTFDYQMRETPSGSWVAATATINVGIVGISVFAKVVFRNYNDAGTGGTVWIDFFSDPYGLTPLDVTLAPFTVLYTKQETYVDHSYMATTLTSTDLSATATGTKIKIYDGPRTITYGPTWFRTFNFNLRIGTGYTGI